tara:strand:- start:729 stop:1820 length:1092 start_codon:yes stop_codon:yes gene_type:complete
MAIIKLNNNSLTSVTELPSGVGADPNVKVDVARLGLRVFANQNLAKQNSTSSSYDVFQDSTGVTNLTNAVRNTNEFVSSAVFSLTGSNTFETATDRQSVYTFTDTIQSGLGLYSGSGTLTKMFDGSVQASNIPDSGSAYLHAAGNTATKNTHYMAFDLGSGATKKAFSGFRWDHQNNTVQYGGTDAWLMQISDDNVNWTDEHAFTWTHESDNTTEITWTPTKASRAIRITPASSLTTSQQTWQRQWYWGTRAYTDAVNATGSFEGVAITASSTSKMGAVISYKNQAGTNALNSDIVLKLSADNGSNYTTATLVDNGDLDSTTKVASVSDVSVTAGTQLKYKIEFANQASGSKEARITGVALQF